MQRAAPCKCSASIPQPTPAFCWKKSHLFSDLEKAQVLHILLARSRTFFRGQPKPVKTVRDSPSFGLPPLVSSPSARKKRLCNITHVFTLGVSTGCQTEIGRCQKSQQARASTPMVRSTFFNLMTTVFARRAHMSGVASVLCCEKMWSPFPLDSQVEGRTDGMVSWTVRRRWLSRSGVQQCSPCPGCERTPRPHNTQFKVNNS